MVVVVVVVVVFEKMRLHDALRKCRMWRWCWERVRSVVVMVEAFFLSSISNV